MQEKIEQENLTRLFSFLFFVSNNTVTEYSTVEEYMWTVYLDSSVVGLLARKVSLWLLGSILTQDLYFSTVCDLAERKEKKIVLSNFLVENYLNLQLKYILR